ncbi:RNA ligase family protein, partial [Salmonella enterica subsp. enterica serovar Enteritidis]|uniref:RNA ligase family protein n=1 Tax=Salmonella enterica TaxID=28901 RepID=UPI0039E9C6C0
GGRERQFNLFKQWAQAHEGALLSLLDDRYQVFGEWMYAKHSLFFDALPHWFCEFDIWDRSAQCFLDTPRRHALLAVVPVVSVPVLY